MEDLYNEIVENLRDWFSKSKSKGGKPGWVQVVSGKPCARQPGQKSTPKCVSSAKRDACYHKVKSRYKVWPSAYASGALVKCRKVGAKNWGNSKKEHIEIMIEDELSQVLEENLTERCEKGYKT